MTRVLLTDYPHVMGGHCGSGALRDLMQWHGLGWDRPPTEGLVFALGGALSFSYVRSAALVPPIYLVGRSGDLELDLIHRLGGQAVLRATDDPEIGWRHVREELDSGRPVLAWADIAELPYLRVRLRMSRHDIVLIGYDDDRQLVHVVDNDRAEVQLVPYDAMARARSSTSFPEPTRHTIYDLTWPDTVPHLGVVLADAFRRSAEAMSATSGLILGNQPSSETDIVASGLAGVAQFADDFLRWPAHFDDTGLDVALRSLSAFVEKAGTGGGLFRTLLAQGADDANTHLRNEAVHQVAAAAARAAAAWSAAAAAAGSAGEPRERHAAAAEQVLRLNSCEVTLRDELAHAAAVLSDA